MSNTDALLERLDNILINTSLSVIGQTATEAAAAIRELRDQASLLRSDMRDASKTVAEAQDRADALLAQLEVARKLLSECSGTIKLLDRQANYESVTDLLSRLAAAIAAGDGK
jgi:chromosome segregation ATPase